MPADSTATAPGTVVAGSPAVEGAADRLIAAWGQVQELMVRMPDEVERRFGLPSHRFQVLSAVQSGASRIQDIADWSRTSMSAASRTVDGLVREGILDRQPDPRDRRASVVTFTAHGEDAYAPVRRWAEGVVGEMVERLGVPRVERVAEELAAFADEVTRILDRDAPD